jgi:hypothetical protein
MVEARDTYGSVRYYPASPAAVLLAALAGTKTLDVASLALAGELGYQIDVDGSQRQVQELSDALAKARGFLTKETVKK